MSLQACQDRLHLPCPPLCFLPQNGQLLLPAAAAQAPSVKVKGGAEGGLFTCVMSDPDAPDPAAPAMREWLHW